MIYECQQVGFFDILEKFYLLCKNNTIRQRQQSLIYVRVAIFQPYHDLEAGDSQSLKL